MQFITVNGIPMVKHGDDLGKLILEAVDKQRLRIENGDLFVVAQTVVSKAEGNVMDLGAVHPSKRSKELAVKLGKDPRLVEVILQQSKEIVRIAHVIISRTKHGLVCANAGVDYSNVDLELVTILPENPEASAGRIRNTVKHKLGVDVAVIISDTQGRPFRHGCVGVAIGISGINPLLDLRGKQDLYGNKLEVTITSPSDSLAAAAVSMMGEADEGTPVVLVKGANYESGEGTIREIVRPPELDLFR